MGMQSPILNWIFEKTGVLQPASAKTTTEKFPPAEGAGRRVVVGVDEGVGDAVWDDEGVCDGVCDGVSDDEGVGDGVGDSVILTQRAVHLSPLASNPSTKCVSQVESQRVDSVSTRPESSQASVS